MVFYIYLKAGKHKLSLDFRGSPGADLSLNSLNSLIMMPSELHFNCKNAILSTVNVRIHAKIIKISRYLSPTLPKRLYF